MLIRGKTLGSYLIILSIFTSVVFSQSKNDNTVVGSVGKEKITYGELKKNLNSGPSETITMEELENFLPIYLEYKAKIQFAQKEGVFDDTELNAELNLYAKQASYSFWLDNKIKETQFDIYYQRASTEVKGEHILITVPQNASPADTLAAYQKLIEARDKFLAGVSFSDLDNTYSSKQNGRSMGGDLPWFSVGTTVKEFENAIYSLEKDEISMPFRTQFGFHIVHLQNRRPRTISREVSHIFTRAGVKESKAKIDNAYSELNDGNPWAEVTNKYSDDNLSAANAGKIGWINYGRYRSEFVDSVMSLDPNQPYSKPIQTFYGYHIFKIDSVQSFTSVEAKKESYMEEFLNSPNFQKSNSFVIDWLKNEYTNELNIKAVNALKDFIVSKDTVKIKDISSSDSNEVFYQFKNYTFSKNDYWDYLVKTHPDAAANTYSDNWINDFVTYSIDSKIIKLTLSEFPDFESTLDNYKKGLAVYEINDTYLWSSATVDTSRLRNIYTSSPNEYKFPQRYYYHLLSTLTDSTLKKGIEFIKAGNHPDSVRSYIPRIAVNKDSTGIVIDEPYVRLEKLKPGTFSETFDFRKRKSIFYLNEILPERRMTFDEAFNRILTEYQPIREEEWLSQLKKDFKVKVNLDKLRSAYKKDLSL